MTRNESQRWERAREKKGAEEKGQGRFILEGNRTKESSDWTDVTPRQMVAYKGKGGNPVFE